MRCPHCEYEDTQVKDSRPLEEGKRIRRRRECKGCGARFTTYESPERSCPQIVKSNGEREQFVREKLLQGMQVALHKRKVASDALGKAVDRIVAKLEESGKNEIKSKTLGEWVMEELRRLDHVAYIRFASVYLDFTNVRDFLPDLERLLEELPPDHSDQQLDFWTPAEGDDG